MRIWAALPGVLLSALVCFSGINILIATAEPSADNSTAFITQDNTPSREYDTFFGQNWDSVRTFRLLRTLDKPLKVYIEANPKQSGLYRPHYKDYILQGLDSWAEALDGRLSYMLVNNPDQADITIDWVPGFADRYVAGVTTYRVGHAQVEIKTVGVPDKDIQGNIIHELGHALGIAGHSNDAGDIMVGMRKWDRENNYRPQLSQRDIQAIRRLYSATWKKGEDLYSDVAQSMPVAPVASSGFVPVAQVGQAPANAERPAVLNKPTNQPIRGIHKVIYGTITPIRR